MASNVGCRSVGELEITRRILAVALCCSCASASSRSRALRAFVISAYDGAGELLGLAAVSGMPHFSQKFAWGRFSCWQAGHSMPTPPLLERGQGSTDNWPV